MKLFLKNSQDVMYINHLTLRGLRS